ncbi:hypothetical protein BT67DRAFT_37031 [Trichocladium antarcticum]|uniref:Uncharacterized protein n=1 Tax=Trichocladium antarcticum TaxID=1450529 RepID=A0AAN6UJV5_9PEZI|nr:hypothetical protein BT67DRAFT_37031 [Trichocladium antarcticum]
MRPGSRPRRHVSNSGGRLCKHRAGHQSTEGFESSKPNRNSLDKSLSVSESIWNSNESVELGFEMRKRLQPQPLSACTDEAALSKLLEKLTRYIAGAMLGREGVVAAQFWTTGTTRTPPLSQADGVCRVYLVIYTGTGTCIRSRSIATAATLPMRCAANLMTRVLTTTGAYHIVFPRARLLIAY